jgi:hypothetical protein
MVRHRKPVASCASQAGWLIEICCLGRLRRSVLRIPAQFEARLALRTAATWNIEASNIRSGHRARRVEMVGVGCGVVVVGQAPNRSAAVAGAENAIDWALGVKKVRVVPPEGPD